MTKIVPSSKWSRYMHVSKKQIGRYLTKHHLSNTKENRKTARKAIRDRLKSPKSPPGKDVSFKQSAADWQIIYGKQRVGGIYTFAGIGSTNNRELLLVITLAAHKINAVTKLFFDDTEVAFSVTPGTNLSGWATGDYENKVYIEVNLGDEHQSALAGLVTDSGGIWTTNHRQRGHAHVYLKLIYSEERFPSGLPEVSFEVEGKVLESVASGYGAGYSTNAAHCLGDFIKNKKFGGNRYVSSCDVAFGNGDEALGYELTEALDICNQSVTLNSGGSEKRYTCNTNFLVSESVTSIVDQMLSAFGGSLCDYSSAYKIKLLAPKYRSPTMAFTEADFLSEVQVSTVDSLTEHAVSIGGTYIDPDKNWEETDFPPINTTSTYGMTNREDISLPCTTSVTMAQRIAKTELKRRQFDTTVQFTAPLKAYKLIPGDTVTITYSHFSWTAKVFEVNEVQLVFTDDDDGNMFLAVDLVLQETSSTIYDWTASEEATVNAMPTNSFPQPKINGTSNPTNLVLDGGVNQTIIQSDGTALVRLKASWTAPTDFFVINGGYIEIQYKKSSSSNWLDVPTVTGSTTSQMIDIVQMNEFYDVRIRPRNSVGMTGAYLYQFGYQILGNTSPPSDVANFIYTESATLLQFSWNPVPDANVAFYRIKREAAAPIWAVGILVGEFVEAIATLPNATGSTGFPYYIKAVNFQGVESANHIVGTAATAITTGNPLGLLLALTKN